MSTNKCTFTKSHILCGLLLTTVLLPSSQSCRCPSCYQSSVARRCECCVYRQLGKRSHLQGGEDFQTSDPVVNFFSSRQLTQNVNNERAPMSVVQQRGFKRDEEGASRGLYTGGSATTAEIDRDRLDFKSPGGGVSMMAQLNRPGLAALLRKLKQNLEDVPSHRVPIDVLLKLRNFQGQFSLPSGESIVGGKGGDSVPLGEYDNDVVHDGGDSQINLVSMLDGFEDLLPCDN